MNNQTKSFLTTCVFLFMIIMLNGCVTSSYFTLTENQKPPIVPDTIAVISGSASEIDIHLANKLTEELSNTKFKVMSQEQITKIIPDYPLNIINFTCEGKKFKQPYISDESKKIVDAMQSKLKVKYVLLIWNNGVGTVTYTNRYGQQSGKEVEVCILTRFLIYPEATIVGYSFFCDSKSLGYFFMINQEKKIAKTVEELLNKGVKKIVKEIVKNTENPAGKK